MVTLSGKSVYKGITFGPVVVFKKHECQVKRTRIEDIEAEIERVNVAVKDAQDNLQVLYESPFH